MIFYTLPTRYEEPGGWYEEAMFERSTTVARLQEPMLIGSWRLLIARTFRLKFNSFHFIFYHIRGKITEC